MKRLSIFIIALMGLSLLGAGTLESFADFAGGINARFEGLRQSPMVKSVEILDEDDEFPATPLISKTFAFPYQNVNLNINEMSWRVFDKEGNYVQSRSKLVLEAVNALQPFTFREMQGITVQIQTQYEDEENVFTLDALDFDLQGANPIPLPTSVSSAFVDAYKFLADNWEYSYLRNLPVARPKMLIISHAALENHQKNFIKWKRQLGFDIHVMNKSDAGESISQIRQSIRNFYSEHRPDYLLLLGDTVGTFRIPTSFYPSPQYQENDADDQYYALMNDDDYFPDILVGRFSFTEIMEFIVMTTKTIRYESEPFMGNTAWMKRALVAAGNYAETSPYPTTPVSMSRWFYDRLLDYGYAAADTVFYPPSYPGTAAIQQSINQGVQIISYRGWGDVNGWHYPAFHSSDLSGTMNGPRMPIVYSFVCNTGDFANTSQSTCFGERWMRMGTSANLGGCVAFVGPSDLHTKTRLNNSISSGTYRSILDYGVRTFGSTVLFGKIELYKNFQNDIAPDQYVPFYFHVYNLLSDPSMNMWILEPNTISESIIEGGLTFPQSASHIRINAPHLEGAMVSGSKDGLNFSYAKVVNGVAILTINPEETGNLLITISLKNHVPLVRTLNVEGEAGLGIAANGLVDQRINANQSISGSLTLKNYSEQSFSGILAEVEAYPNLEISLDHNGAFDLAPGESFELGLSISANHLIHPDDVINLTLKTQNPSSEHIFSLTGGGARLSVWAHSGTLPVGESADITFTVGNIGTGRMQNARVIAQSLTEAATIAAVPITIGDILPGEDKTFSVNISQVSDAFDGRNIPLRFDFEDDTAYEWMCLYAITAGTPGVEDPTGPDEYGYFAYDSGDFDYHQAPVYDWVELDPLLGGEGDLWLIMDDGVKHVPLPFNFRFYGVDYDSITISSNGWVSFVPCGDSYFNNHYIPAALGPQAMLAPYWDDLKGKKIGTSETNQDIFADMRILYWHDTENNRFIVQWNEAYNQYTIQAGENASLEKFQVILLPKTDDDGDVIFQYHTVDNPGLTTNYCTVGIEDHRQLSGLSYTHCNFYPVTAKALQAGLAIRFTTSAPDLYVSNQDEVAELVVSGLRNYPNPFNPSTTIAFYSPQAADAELKIYNMKGQLVRKLFAGEIKRGENSFVWDGCDDTGLHVSSGIYLYRLSSNKKSYSQKMLMMK